MFDVTVLGELLIDFTPCAVSEKGNPLFEQNPGGGPANLACTVAKLGRKVAFVGKVGQDFFGDFLKQSLRRCAVNTDALIQDKEHKTTLAFVHLDETGDRSFSFYRKNGADTLLEYQEIPETYLKDCRYFFFSSVLMAEGSSRKTSFQAVQQAKANGVPLVFDPNLRLNLWDDAKEAETYIRQALALADIVKLSGEELEFLTGSVNYEEASAQLMQEFPLKALLVTLGKDGCFARTAKTNVFVPGFSVNTVDTTAAGDSFTGGFLRELLRRQKPVTEYSTPELQEAVRFANAVGALTTTKTGGIPALPSLEEVHKLLALK